MELHNFSELKTRLSSNASKPVVAVAGAADLHVLESVARANEQGLVNAILVGDAAKIRDGLQALSRPAGDFTVLEPSAGETVAEAAVRLVRDGEADMLMKGMIETSDFLRPVVNKEHGLGTGKVMSHFGVHELAGYPKLLAVTDAAMCTFPDLDKKSKILANVIEAYRYLGYEEPKVACLCCKETVDPKLVDTTDAQALHQMSLEGTFGKAYVSGPISYDIAMDPEIAQIKKYPDMAYSGNYDILMVPNIHAGNILGKCLCITCHATMGGIVMGAKVPIILTSRGATPEEKMNSILLAAAAANGASASR